MMILTYWEDPKHKSTPDDYDALYQVRLSTVKQIPMLIAEKPNQCTMISTEHSSYRILKNGDRTNFFKIVWESGDPIMNTYTEIYCSSCGNKYTGYEPNYCGKCGHARKNRS
jgi:hypothetical protein